MADEKIIFSMCGVGKTLPHNNKNILKDIYLSFFYGAKIGIIGLNGSGKSTLMKIIAGVETSYKGEVVWAPGYSVGYLEQEPQMDGEKTVIEVVREGVQEVMDLLKDCHYRVFPVGRLDKNTTGVLMPILGRLASMKITGIPIWFWRESRSSAIPSL